ncbi:hypothetical protein SAMN05444920_103549 [Nonomuraea solani]|uniref:Uncharacterized protein n=1 Tax=Nonomuraea solani TaxID=1144553 RepID=A0A1H6BQF2_9ACTN|nr:hypothetical protein [Nonomuraea solani]SEG62675.1 hypothetical protein SAMN05444920_103549 [Nonomuraea solani]
MGALVAGLSVACGIIVALVCWIVLNALGADGVVAFTTSAGAVVVVSGAVVGLVQFVRNFDKKS